MASRRDRINAVAADLAVAASRSYPEFKKAVQEVEDRYPLETRREIAERLADTTPNPAT